ncbi:MAG: phytanoyl-CoA dioxygenase family protein [Armatimonadetes bacterium]|nr:phytanoyl-CoA dioxygenase family protein [Anaerolineae bacterium]
MTSYQLTPEQIAFFDENGYLVLRNWIPSAMLASLQAAGKAWIDEGLTATADNPHHIDFHFANRAAGRTMYRVDYVHNKDQVASLELLGSPQVLGVAESLCGANFVPTYESMVFKQEGDGEAIKWHQDAVHTRTHRIFNYDLYLDASRTGGGALWVIPKSQTQPHDICALTDAYGWDVPGAIEVEMLPGDVLLHDVMVVHGSPHTEGNPLRRTIYYEFRAAEEIIQDGPWDATWIDQRLRLIALGIKRYATAYPDDEQFTWQVADGFRPQMTSDEAAELRIAHLVHMSGSYCSASSIPKAETA